jgi:hypothetical protein
MTSLKSRAAARRCKGNCEQSKEEHKSKEPSLEQQSAAQRFLAQAIERERLGLEGLPPARFQLVKTFGRIELMGEQIDQAFGGQPFWRNLPPDCPANRRRFNAYLEFHSKLTRLLGKAIELWMLTCGMKTADDWVPLLIAQMNQNAAKSRANPNQGNVMDRLRATLASESS